MIHEECSAIQIFAASISIFFGLVIVRPFCGFDLMISLFFFHTFIEIQRPSCTPPQQHAYPYLLVTQTTHVFSIVTCLRAEKNGLPVMLEAVQCVREGQLRTISTGEAILSLLILGFDMFS